MIVGLGIDVVQVDRIRSLRERRGERFLRRVFTEAELKACVGRADPDEALAVRFAAKEAAMKALGTGWARGVGWRELEVVSAPGEAPQMLLSGRAAQRAAGLGTRGAKVSLTHDAGVAAAVVILEGVEGLSP